MHTLTLAQVQSYRHVAAFPDLMFQGYIPASTAACSDRHRSSSSRRSCCLNVVLLCSVRPRHRRRSSSRGTTMSQSSGVSCLGMFRMVNVKTKTGEPQRNRDDSLPDEKTQQTATTDGHIFYRDLKSTAFRYNMIRCNCVET